MIGVCNKPPEESNERTQGHHPAAPSSRARSPAPPPRGISGFPFISYGQSDVIRIGHLTPRTGFLGPLGEFAVQAVDMAVAEINAAGGINGRKIELLKEDSVNPQTASTKAERMIERDKVACIIGEISSASALTISQVAERTKTLVHQHRRQLRRAARQELQASTCSTSRARTRCT